MECLLSVHLFVSHDALYSAHLNKVVTDQPPVLDRDRHRHEA